MVGPKGLGQLYSKLPKMLSRPLVRQQVPFHLFLFFLLSPSGTTLTFDQVCITASIGMVVHSKSERSVLGHLLFFHHPPPVPQTPVCRIGMRVSLDLEDSAVDSAVAHAALVELAVDLGGACEEEAIVAAAVEAMQHRRVQDAISLIRIFTPIILVP